MKRFTSAISALIIGMFFMVNVAMAATPFYYDVIETDWFYTYVWALVDHSVLDASFDYYRPSDLLNRAEAVKVIVKSAGYEIEDPETPTFLDVPKGEWFYGYVETAVKYGAVSGYEDDNEVLTGYFGPADPVTREQFSKMGVLGNTLELVNVEQQEPTFEDVQKALWSFIYIESAFLGDVIDGYPDGLFKPMDNINRAEMAKMVYGFLPDDEVGPLCFREGDDLGPDEPDNTNICCPGLAAYTPPELEGTTKGICYNPWYIPVPTI